VDTTVSPRIKIVALVGLVLALAGGGGMMLLGRSQEDFSEPLPTSSVPAATTPAAQKPARTKAAAAKPAVTKAAAPAPKPKPKPPVAANGLPTPLDELLHTHRVVVVALYDGEVASDKIARDEAHAGAVDAGAGFLGVNVLDERVSSPLTALAGNGTLLPAPGILVYKRPGVLMNRIEGFADRVAIAEAVANALLVPMSSVPAPAPAPAPATTTPTTPTPLP
jgi:hypothetical protein